MKILLVSLLLLVYLLMSYGGGVLPLRALVGSVLIAVIARKTWPEGWRDRLGLRMSGRELALAAILAPILMVLLHGMIRGIAEAGNVVYRASIAAHGMFSPIYLHTLGQTLNEEMILGALLLNAIRRAFGKAHPLWVAAAVAMLFTLLHYVFYRWIVLPGYRGTLTWETLVVLLAIGMLRNTLILKTGHIAYAWCVHLSINLVGLLGMYRFANGDKLMEPEIFNFILGSQAAVMVSVVILIGCIILLLRTTADATIKD